MGGIIIIIVEANPIILTSREIRAIDSYVRCQESSESEALRILKLNRFNSKQIHGASKGNHYYYATEEIQEVYKYYQENYPLVFSKRRIQNFNDLLDKAFHYCEEHSNSFTKIITRY